MPPFGPIKRRDLIQALRKAGFEGPIPGGKHEFMVKGHLRLVLPNPHQGEIKRELLVRLLRQVQLNRDDWEQL